MTDDRAFLPRLVRAFTFGGEPAQGGCPAADSLWSAFHGGAPLPERESIVDHLASCASCAADWALLGTASAAGEPASSGERASSFSRRRGRWSALLPAAALLLASVSIVAVLFGPVAPPAERAGSASEIHSLVPNESLPRNSVVLRWSDLGAGVRYTIDVTTEDLTLLATGRGLATPEYRVTEDVLRSLSPGAVLVWRVEAVAPDGRRTVSPAFRVRLR